MAQFGDPVPAVDNSEAGSGLVRVMTNDQLESTEKTRGDVDHEQDDPFVHGLVQHVMMAWQASKTNKWVMEEKLLKSLRQRRGKYDPDDLARIEEFGGSQIFMMLSSVKCRAIEAWVKDVVLPAGDKPWGVDPTPLPDLPKEIEERIASRVLDEVREVMMTFGPDVVDEGMVEERLDEVRAELKRQLMKRADMIAQKQETHLEDELREGNFYEEFEKFIKDFATYQTAFIKGPIIRKRARLIWKNGKPDVKWTFRREWQRINPFDIYPSPGARNLNDGYFIERMRVRRTDLMSYRGAPNFSQPAIDNVLEKYQLGGLKNWIWTDQERANLEDRVNEQEDPEAIIEVLAFHGAVQGYKLLEWGMTTSDIPNPTQDYECEAWLVDQWVIMAKLNRHPLRFRGMYNASFEEQNDTIWGLSPPELMEDCQRTCNAAARQLINNMAIASGPQVEVQADRVDPKEDIEDIYPWKVWRTKSDEMGRKNFAVQFYQPNPMADMLMKVYEYFFKQAGEQLGVPAYEHGSPNVGGAGRTAHGLAMLMSSSAKIMRQAITNIDEGVIRPLIYDLWLHMMMHESKMPKNGDINIIARASEYLVIAEQLQARRTELLGALNNPIDHAIIGNAGRAKILREVLKNMKLPEDIVPDEDEILMRDQMMQQQPLLGPGAAAGGGSPRIAAPGPGENLLPPGQQPGVEGSRPQEEAEAATGRRL